MGISIILFKMRALLMEIQLQYSQNLSKARALLKFLVSTLRYLIVVPVRLFTFE